VQVVVPWIERDLALYASLPQVAAFDRHSAGCFDLMRAEVDTFRERFEQMGRRFDFADRHLVGSIQHPRGGTLNLRAVRKNARSSSGLAGEP